MKPSDTDKRAAILARRLGGGLICAGILCLATTLQAETTNTSGNAAQASGQAGGVIAPDTTANTSANTSTNSGGNSGAISGPISAIDWLSQSVARPDALDLQEQSVATHAGVENITVQTLDAPSLDAAGLLPADLTGLPVNLWGSGRSEDISRLILAGPADPLPALSELRRQILLAEARPPLDSDGTVLLARIDKLLDLGALEDALALLEQSGAATPELYRRRFDAALLLGSEDRACDELRDSGAVAPSYQVRVFCLARNGDWNAAVLTLNSAEVLGVLAPGEYDLMARFLDPELFEGAPPLPVPHSPTPLVYRMFEAIGEPVPTPGLPRAFAHADLRSISGWKARIEAGERLARVGAIPENQLLGIYSERLPAASGGVWQRVATIQNFERELIARDVQALEIRLPILWAMLQQSGLERPFARMFAAPLAGIELGENGREVAWRLALLSDGYETLTAGFTPQTAEEIFLQALARGVPETTETTDARARAVQEGFDGTPLNVDARTMLNDQRLGELILMTLARFDEGASGDLNQVTESLRVLRALGLEDTARQAGLQFLLSDPRG